MANKIRVKKIAERIQQEMSEILLYSVTDPRLNGVTVTEVQLDRELAYATIYVSAVEGSEREREILDGFESAKGFMRHQLSQLIDLRSFPHLRFKWDATAEKAARVEELLDQLRKENEEDKPDA